MYKDPTEFRARFKAYKEGKMPYENGLPKFAGGTPGLVNPYTLPLLQEFEGFKDTVYLDGKGIPTIGWGFTDSSLVNKGRISRKEADAELQRLAGNVESDLISKLGIDNWKQMSPESQAALISYAYNYPAGFKDTTNFMKLWRAGKYWDAIDEVDAGMYDKANPGLKKRRLKEQSYLRKDPFFLATSSAPPKKTDAELKIPIINKTDAATINKVIPQEQTHTTWEGARDVSPYLTGKPMLRPIHRIRLPNLIDIMEDDLWEPRFPGLKNGKLPCFGKGKGDGMRYLFDDKTQSWDRITNDELARMFADITVTPNGNRDDNRTLPVYKDPRLKYAGYVTKSMLEDQARVPRQTETGMYAPGLEQVSPEFDALLLTNPFRFNNLFWRNKALAKEIDKTVDEGLVGSTKDMPVFKASDMYNPEHFRSAVKYNPKLIGVVSEKTAGSKKLMLSNKKVKSPIEDFDLNDGLHTYPIEDHSNNAINLIKGVGSPSGDYNAIKFGITLIARPKRPHYTSFDLAPDPPESVYSGNIPKTIIPINQIGLHSGEIINPQIFLTQLKLLSSDVPPYSDETFVDRNGVVNMRNLIKIMQLVRKDFPYMQDYKNINNSSGNLFKHTSDVVRSALNIPVPKGYTRLDLVLAALFHDVGKVLDGTINHGKTSANLMDTYAPNVPKHVRDAVYEHMSGKLDLANPLSKALHFADVARGQSYDEAAYNFPHLLYDRDIPELNILKIPLKEELKTRINPWLQRLGYPTINLNSTEEEAFKELLDRIRWHKTLERGVRDPIKLTNYSPDNIRNERNVILGIMDKYGVDEFTAKSDEFLPQRLEFAATTIPKDPTGSGRSNLFSTPIKNGLTEHKSTDYSRLIGADRNALDGLYVSTSDQVKNTYSTSSNDRGGGGYEVMFPENERRPGESLSEYLLRNDWELYNTDKLKKGPLGTFAMYEGPYRLLTGRSLVSDMKKDKVLKPAYTDNPKNVLYPGLSVRLNRYVKHTYDLAILNLDHINKNLSDFGIDFKLTPTTSGGIVKYDKQLSLGHKLELLSILKSQLNEFKPNFFDAKSSLLEIDPQKDKQMGSRLVDKDVLDALSDPKYLEYASQTPPLNFIIENGTSPFEGFANDSNPFMRDGKLRRLRNDANLDVGILRELVDDGMITLKQSKAARKAFKYSMYKDLNAASKYIDIKKIANKYLDKYLDLVRGKKISSSTIDYRSMQPTPAQMLDYMRSKGVLPRYEIDGFNKNRLFAVSGPDKNKTINQPLSKEIYGYILGKKGELVVQKRANVGYKKTKADSRRGRDYGERTNDRMTRKTFRTIGGIATIGAANEKLNKDK